MKFIIGILCVLINAVTADPMVRFFNNNGLQIGFGKDCYLFWRGDSGNRKNGEFRCGSSRGDPMWIRTGRSANHYFIGSDVGPLFWNGDPGSVKNAEFRRGSSPSDQFWIRKQSNGMYAIGFDNCPLFWRGDAGNTKNAEFRCGSAISDTFWIKNDGCKLSKVEVLDTTSFATPDGEKIVGIASAGSCSSGSHTLVLSHTIDVTEEVGMEISESIEHSWEVSASVTVEASAKFLGSGGSVSATLGAAYGGAVSYGSSNTKSTSQGSSSGSSVETSYDTPGGAMVVGFVKEYKFDKSSLPAKATVSCAGGYSFSYATTVKLKTKIYGYTFFKHFAGKFLPGQCTQDKVNCLYKAGAFFTSYKETMEARSHFAKCFPSGIGAMTKK